MCLKLKFRKLIWDFGATSSTVWVLLTNLQGRKSVKNHKSSSVSNFLSVHLGTKDRLQNDIDVFLDTTEYDQPLRKGTKNGVQGSKERRCPGVLEGTRQTPKNLKRTHVYNIWCNKFFFCCPFNGMWWWSFASLEMALGSCSCKHQVAQRILLIKKIDVLLSTYTHAVANRINYTMVYITSL